MTRPQAILFLLLQLLLPCSSFSQQFAFEHYNSNNGLPANTVYFAMQDSKGFIWFGTEAGACRYDGINFQSFSIDDGLSDNEILGIYEDSKGRVWFLTLNGKLSYYLNDKFYNTENDSLLKKASVNYTSSMLLEDRQGNIWIPTFSGTVVKINKENRTATYHLPDRNNALSRSYLCENEKGELLVFTGDKVYCITPNGLEYRYKKTTPVSKGVFLVPLPDSRALFCDERGVEILDHGQYNMILPVKEIPKYDQVLRIRMNEKGDLLINYVFGSALLYMYDKNINGYMPAIQLLKGMRINETFFDNEQNLWFCSAGSGIYKLSKKSLSVITYNMSNGLSSDQPVSVTADGMGNIFTGHVNGMVDYISGKEIKHFNANLVQGSFNRINGMVIDSGHHVWCAMDNGVARIRYLNGNYLEPEQIPLEITGLKSPDALYATKGISLNNDNIIYVTWWAGVCKAKTENGRTFIEPLTIPAFGTRSFCQYVDFKKRLWIANNTGLNRIAGDSVISYGLHDNLLSKRILQITQLADSTFILATSGSGLFMFDGEKVIHRITRKDGLGGDICKRMFIKNDTIFVATNNGLSRIVYNGNVVHHIETFGLSDGLLSNEVNDVCMAGNMLYVATSSGLSVIPVDFKKVISDPPPVYFSKIKINGVPVEVTDHYDLQYFENNVMVSFISPCFDNAQLIKYQYRINSNNDNWITVDGNFVELSSLQPGDYGLQIRVKKYNSEWSKAKQLLFHINTPFWQTTWFRLTYTALSLVIVFIILSYIISSRYKAKLALFEKEKALSMERNRIAADMHDDIGADMSHLLLLARLAESNRKTEDKENASRIETAILTIIEKMDEIIWALNPSNDSLMNLELFLKKHALNYFDLNKIPGAVETSNHGINLEVKSALRRNIFMVFKELLHNIHKHAGARGIKINISASGEPLQIHLEIVDNGIGFDPADYTGPGNGLINIKKRISEINGKVKFTSFPGEGTVVNISVPLK